MEAEKQGKYHITGSRNETKHNINIYEQIINKHDENFFKY